MKKQVLTLLSLITILGMSSCGGNSQSSSSKSNTSVQTTTSYIDPSELEDFSDFDNFESRDNVIKKDVDNTPIPAADPFIFRYNGVYYLYSTNGYSNMKCFSSTDLINWKYEGIAYNGAGYDTSDGTTLYAPEVRYYDGLFYMIFRGSSKGLYVLTSDLPTGLFTVNKRIGDYTSEIDQSYFIDSNENIYLYTSGGGGIHAYQMSNMNTINGANINIKNATMKPSWTEGPYMLQRYGKCYLTYTGTHFKSDTYRVDYVTCENDKSLMTPTAYSQRKDTIVVSTKNDFSNLGHSMTVLGPDLDSYYVVYHNSTESSLGSERNLNYSRLSFNGSYMKADSVRSGEITDLYQPEFTAVDSSEMITEGDFILSDVISEKEFTVEYNVTGNGTMVFSYGSDEYYGYIEYADNTLSLGVVESGNERTIEDIELIKEYDPEVNHTIRLQYSNNEVSLYFDDIEKMGKQEIDFEYWGGKCGYIKNTFDEIGYTSMSNVAHGSSDSKTYHEDFNLANSYNEYLSILTDNSQLTEVTNDTDWNRVNSYNFVLDGDDSRATYKMYANKTGNYYINLRATSESQNKDVYLKIDNNEPMLCSISDDTPELPKIADIECNLARVRLTEGPHHISLVYAGDKVGFNEISYICPTKATLNESFMSSYDSTKFNLRGSASFNNGLRMDAAGKTNGLVSLDTFQNCSTTLNFVTDSSSASNEFGLVINSSAFGLNLYDYPNAVESFKGMYFKLSGNNLSFLRQDFYKTEILGTSSKSFSAGSHSMRISQENNHYMCYFDDALVFDIITNISYLGGNVAFLGANTNIAVTGLNVSQNS